MLASSKACVVPGGGARGEWGRSPQQTREWVHISTPQ